MKHIIFYLLASVGLACAQTKTVGPQGQGIGSGDRSAFLDALGGSTAGKALFQMSNPGAITFPRINADNSVSALSAAGFRTALKPARYSHIAFFGDSITAQTGGITYSGDVAAFRFSDGFPAWMHLYMGGRFSFLRTLPTNHEAHGYSGYQCNPAATFSLHGHPLDGLIASGAKCVVELSGANDIIAGRTGAQMAADRIALWDSMLARGVEQIVALATLPLFLSANNLQVAAANTTLQAAAAARNIIWVPFPAEFESGGVAAEPEFLRDGVHPTTKAAQRLALAVNTAIDSIIAPQPYRLTLTGAADFAGPNTLTWLTNNPQFVGTGGTLGNTQASGTVATSWDLRGPSDGTAVGSIVTEDGYTWQQMVVMSASRTAATQLRVAAAASPPVGAIIRPVARIKVTGGAQAGLRGIRNLNPMGAIMYQQSTGFSNNVADDYSGVIIGPDYPITGTATGVSLDVLVYGSGTIKVAQVGFLRIR